MKIYNVIVVTEEGNELFIDVMDSYKDLKKAWEYISQIVQSAKNNTDKCIDEVNALFNEYDENIPLLVNSKTLVCFIVYRKDNKSITSKLYIECNSLI